MNFPSSDRYPPFDRQPHDRYPPQDRYPPFDRQPQDRYPPQDRYSPPERQPSLTIPQLLESQQRQIEELTRRLVALENYCRNQAKDQRPGPSQEQATPLNPKTNTFNLDDLLQ